MFILINNITVICIKENYYFYVSFAKVPKQLLSLNFYFIKILKRINCFFFRKKNLKSALNLIERINKI